MGKEKRVSEQLHFINGHRSVLYTKGIGIAAVTALICYLLLLSSPAAMAKESNIYQSATSTPQQYPNTPTTPTNTARQDHAHALQLARSGKFARAAAILAPYAKQPMAQVLITGDYLVFLSWAGKQQQAIRSFEQLPAAFPKNAYLSRNMAKAYYDQKQYPAAAKLYASTLRQTPADEEAQKGHVLSLYHAGRLKESDAQLHAYLKANPNNLALQSLMPQILIDSGAYARAWAAQADLLRQQNASSAEQHKAWEALLASVPADKRAAMTAALKQAASSGKASDIENHILALALQRQFPAVITNYESSTIKAEQLSTYAAYWVGWSYFKADQLKQAAELYRNSLKRSGHDMHTATGLAYVLGKQKKAEQALKLLAHLPAEQSRLAEVHFARAYIYEQQSDYWAAVKEYDAILAVYPNYRTASKLKLMAMSALGASSPALGKAAGDRELQAYIRGHMAIDRMQWGEFKQSLSQLETLLQRRYATGTKFDHIVVLVEDLQMQEAINAYEKLKAEGIEPPFWVMNSVGSAYVYLEDWEKALAVYNQQLTADPHMFNARVGKFYSLSELRRWNEAETLLQALERDVIPVNGRSHYSQDQQMEVVVAHGWFMVDQNMLREADTYFTEFYKKAPANTEIRSGLAHTHYFRGWPRQSLREFQTIRSMEARDINPGPRVGHALVLNALAHKEEARDMISTYRLLKPKDKHGIRAARELEVDDMRELDAGIAFGHSDDGFDDFFTYADYIHPITLYTNLLATVNYRRSGQSNTTSIYHRVGLGFDHTFNSDWYIREVVSMDIKKGGEFGSRTDLRYTPTDHWTFEGMFDSFTIDVPLRARAANIRSNMASLGITYRVSESREYAVGATYYGFSDGNKRLATTARLEQQLYAKKDWRLRLIVDGYWGNNSLRNAAYFNPSHDWSAAGTLMVEQTVWHAYESMKGYYDRGFIHRLYLTAGTYAQANFGSSFLGSARYEQEIDFSDTHHLLWGVTAGRHSYDGVGVMNYSIDALYRWYF